MPIFRGNAMKCDEVQEGFVDLLYREPGTPAPSKELLDHIGSCAACRKELAGLRELQSTLKIWQDEAPLRPVLLPRSGSVRSPVRIPVWRAVRFAAAAALVILALLSLSNAQIAWDKNGFSFRTSILPLPVPPTDYYTRQEMNTILKAVMEDSREYNWRMMQFMRDAIDQEHNTDFRNFVRVVKENRGRN
ncbi:MAG: hypothetical protein H6Q05_722 [Acidobacteria bacterium]|nr:hypothetical protein [Acidobacteriota bacterium]